MSENIVYPNMLSKHFFLHIVYPHFVILICLFIYFACRRVFGEDVPIYLCQWHVLECWKTNALAKMRLDEESRDWIYYGLRNVMYMDIIWKETENDFIERAKANANFVFDTAKDYRRARIVSTIDIHGIEQIAYELERDLHNIDVFQAYFEG